MKAEEYIVIVGNDESRFDTLKEAQTFAKQYRAYSMYVQRTKRIS